MKPFYKTSFIFTVFRWGTYLVKNLPSKPHDSVEHSTPLSTYGFGIAIATVHAKYLNGDVQIHAIENYGTDAYIYIQADPDRLSEVIPIYTAQTDDYYKSSSSKADQWITGSNQTIHFPMPHLQ